MTPLSPRMETMTRKTARSFLSLAVLALVSASLTGCLSPFSEHSHDVTEAWAQQANEAHRKWDRYFMGLDWDDPYHVWHDESVASGPMHSY